MTLLARAHLWVFLLLLWGCGGGDKVQIEGDDSPVIMEIGESQISLTQFRFFVEKSYPELLDDEVDDQLNSSFFDKFKRDLVIAEFAKNTGLRITDDRVYEFIETQMTSMSFNLLGPEEQALWRGEISRRLAIQQFLQREILENIMVGEEEVSTYYQEHLDSFKKAPMYRIRQAQFNSKEKADGFRKALRRSKEPFQTVAAEHVEGAENTMVTPLLLETLPEAFQSALKSMRPGRYSKVIPISYGETESFYVLYLESKVPESQVSYEEAYHQIRTKLERDMADNLLQQRMEQFENIVQVDVRYENLPFSYVLPSQRKDS